MEILWTPWRMQYIKSTLEKSDKCIFCELPKKKDKDALIVYRGKYNYVVLNAFPYNSGHVMIVPYRHVSTVEDMTDEELFETMKILRIVLKVLREEYKPEGFNVGWNIGRAAGAGIPGHVHVHVVPRWAGDANFMTVTASVKVLPEALSETWERLRRGFERFTSSP